MSPGAFYKSSSGDILLGMQLLGIEYCECYFTTKWQIVYQFTFYQCIRISIALLLSILLWDINFLQPIGHKMVLSMS